MYHLVTQTSSKTFGLVLKFNFRMSPVVHSSDCRQPGSLCMAMYIEKIVAIYEYSEVSSCPVLYFFPTVRWHYDDRDPKQLQHIPFGWVNQRQVS